MHDGGVAQYFTVPASGVCAVPADLDPAEAAPLMCAGVTCYSACASIPAVTPRRRAAPQSPCST